MEQQTGGFGPGPSDEASRLGMAGDGQAVRAWEPEDDEQDFEDNEQEPEDDVLELEDEIQELEDEEPEGDAWEAGDSADGTEPEGDAWEVAGSEAESASEPPDDPAPVPDVPDLGPRPKTGEPRVDAALARLDELAGRPVTEHRAIFEDVHRRLRDVLGELDTREPPEPDHATRSESRAGR